MSDIKHTPGPWSIHPYSNENPFVVNPEGKPSWAAMDIGIGSGETLIGLVQMCTSNEAGYPHVSIESECKANARLIAAAPELLDAVTPFSRLLKEHHQRLSDDQPIYGVGESLITVGDLRRAVNAIAKATGKEQP